MKRIDKILADLQKLYTKRSALDKQIQGAEASLIVEVKAAYKLASAPAGKPAKKKSEAKKPAAAKKLEAPKKSAATKKPEAPKKPATAKKPETPVATKKPEAPKKPAGGFEFVASRLRAFKKESKTPKT